MQVSMDGLRKNLTQSFNEFIYLIKDSDTFKNMNDREIDQLANIRMFIGSLNCCYDPNDKDDINDLSDIYLREVEGDD